MPFVDYVPTIPVFIRRLADLHGERPLIALGDRRLSYHEAERQSAALGRGLLAAGVTKGTHVGVLMPNGPDWVLAWLATTRIGAVFVPLSTYLRPPELVFMLERADVEYFLTVAGVGALDYLNGLEDCVPDLATRTQRPLQVETLPRLRAIHVFGSSDKTWVDGGFDELVGLASGNPAFDEQRLAAVERQVEPDDTMLIIFSSGSTGDPKGAVHTHRAIIQHTFNVGSFRDINADDRLYSPSPFCWVGGFTVNLLPVMHAGASILCQETFDPGEALDLIERERATIAFGLPPHGIAMAKQSGFGSRDLSSLRAGNLFHVLPEAVRPRDPGLRAQSLGMTETAGPHTLDQEGHELDERQRGTVGKPLPGVEHKLIDPETGEVRPPGTEGEICVRGYNLMQGLYKVDRTKTFDADGFYHTGDLGVFDADGYLYYRGRLGDIIRSGGTNIVPREVEAALVECPEVSEAFVVGIPDAERGELVAAAVVPVPGTAADAENLRRQLKLVLSSYKVPRLIVFVDKNDLPLTTTGKVHKNRLRTLLQGMREKGGIVT